MSKLLGWNRTIGNKTMGYTDYTDSVGTPFWYEIIRENVRGTVYFTVYRDGSHVGSRGTLGLAKDLAENDARLKAPTSYLKARSNPAKRSIKVASRKTLEKRHAKHLAAGRYDKASRAFESYARLAGAHAPKRGKKKNPAKLTREEFEKRYWGKDAHTVPYMTRKEFYSDYRESGLSFAAYKKSTTMNADDYWSRR